jgi:hypothetical protein
MDWQIKYREEQYYSQSNSGKTCTTTTYLVAQCLISNNDVKITRKEEPVEQPEKFKYSRKVCNKLISSRPTTPNSQEDKIIKNKLLHRAIIQAREEDKKFDEENRFKARVAQPMHIFFKHSNKVELYYYYEGMTLEEFQKTNRSKELVIVEDILKTEKLTFPSYRGGVYFAITDAKKAKEFIKDNEWIKKVREAAKKYCKTSSHPAMLFCEMHRRYREGEKISFEKTLQRFREYHPDYNFIPIKW